MLVRAIAVIIWVGVIAYALFAGADFGSGLWDLLAGGDERGAGPRRRIERSIAPVWEANHVWLIFVLVYLWTGFPEPFAALATTLYVPLLLAAAGIVFRGAAFVFRKSSTTLGEARFFGAMFAGASVATPFFLGCVAGAVASGRVPAEGDGPVWSSWLTPASLLGGVLAVATCAWSAAVFLAADSARDGERRLAEYFRARALVAGVVVGAIALVGVWAIETDAPTLASGLHGRGLALVVLSALGGIAALWLLWRRRYALARWPAAAAVVAVVAGWGVGQYPWILVDQVTLAQGAAGSSTLWALVAAFAGAGVLVIPSLFWMLRLTDEGRLEETGSRADSSDAVMARLDRG